MSEERKPFFAQAATMAEMSSLVADYAKQNYVILSGPTTLYDGSLLQALIPAELIFGPSYPKKEI